MSPSIFLSHNNNDKEFVRILARDLDAHGIKYWIDEAEIKAGDALIAKKKAGIDHVDFTSVVLSYFQYDLSAENAFCLGIDYNDRRKNERF